jgi:hypothetical protein
MLRLLTMRKPSLFSKQFSNRLKNVDSYALGRISMAGADRQQRRSGTQPSKVAAVRLLRRVNCKAVDNNCGAGAARARLLPWNFHVLTHQAEAMTGPRRDPVRILTLSGPISGPVPLMGDLVSGIG